MLHSRHANPLRIVLACIAEADDRGDILRNYPSLQQEDLDARSSRRRYTLSRLPLVAAALPTSPRSPDVRVSRAIEGDTLPAKLEDPRDT